MDRSSFDKSAAQNDQGYGFGLGLLEHVFEFADQDGVGVLEEQMEVFEQNDGLFLELLDGDEGFERIVGGGVGVLGDVNEAFYRAPEGEVVFELPGDLFHFGFHALFLGRQDVEARVAGSDVVDDFVSHYVLVFLLLMVIND